MRQNHYYKLSRIRAIFDDENFCNHVKVNYAFIVPRGLVRFLQWTPWIIGIFRWQNWSSGVWPCLFGGRLFFSYVRVLFRRISGIVMNRTAWRFAPLGWGATRMAYIAGISFRFCRGTCPGAGFSIDDES